MNNLSTAKAKLHTETLEQRRIALAEITRQQFLDLQPDTNQASPLKVVVLPYLEYNVAAPSLERLRKVAANFLVVARKAYALNDRSEHLPDQVPKPQLPENSLENQGADEFELEQTFSKLSAHACGTCGGKCCSWGGDEAFLSVDKFREVLGVRPNVGPEEIVAEYMAHVPAQLVHDSCIFHGPQGCGLTRELRSMTCNNYLCAGLHELYQEIQQPYSQYVFAATNFRNVEDAELKVYRIQDATR